MFNYQRQFLLIICIVVAIIGESTFKVTGLIGSAKVQRAGKKSWSNLAVGDDISDNDIIETYFQSRINIQFGTDDLIILGSNSRALLNIKKVDDQVNRNKVNTTVFSGGLFAKVSQGNILTVFTTNAVAKTMGGTITTIVEQKSGHTGFQILGGNVNIRNVSQQQSLSMDVGMTSIVLPGKDPTPPLYMTYRHVSVLKHFFGDDYIQKEIDAAGIKPTKEISSGAKLSLSQTLQQEQNVPDTKIYKKIFVKNNIWGSIIEDQNNKRKDYVSISKIKRVHWENKGELKFKSTVGLANNGIYPMFNLVPNFHFPKFSIGINLPLAKTADGNMSINLNSAAGVLDKIDHFTIGTYEKDRYFTIGSLEDYTIGKGLLVKRFNNRSIYSVTQPKAMVLKIKKNIADFDFFIADIVHWGIGGFHFSFMPGLSWLGFGVYWDSDLYRQSIMDASARFINQDTLYDDAVKHYNCDSTTIAQKSAFLEFNIGLKSMNTTNQSLEILFQIAVKPSSRIEDKGILFRVPDIRIKFNQFKFGLAYIMEKGPVLDGHFGSAYMSNRSRIHWNSSNDSTYYETQNMLLTPFQLSKEQLKDTVTYLDEEGHEDRFVEYYIPGTFRSYGYALSFNWAPKRGMNLDFDIKQSFLTYKSVFDTTEMYDTITKLPAEIDTNIQTKKTYSKQTNNINFDLTFKINKYFFPYIEYAEFYIRSAHGGYFPNTGNPFSSWGFSSGFNVISKPLFINIALELGLLYTYIDLLDASGLNKPNNIIDDNDNLIDIYLGIRWGFL